MQFIQGNNRSQHILFPDSLDQFVDQENEVRILDLFVGASADVGCMFIAYNLRKILNILDQDILKKFFQELAFFPANSRLCKSISLSQDARKIFDQLHY